MKTLDILSNHAQTKVNALNDLCKGITDKYNAIGKDKYNWEGRVGYYPKDCEGQPVLFRLFDKIIHMGEDLGSPQSIKEFLTRIVTKGVKMQHQKHEETPLGMGHFRWDWKAYTLSENEVKAISQYLNIEPTAPAVPITNKTKYQFSLMDYDGKADYFLHITETTFTAEYKDHDYYFDGDKDCRDIFNITLKNTNNRFRFTFGQSINNTGKALKAYDVLASLTKYDCGTFNDFCSEFGYEQDSRSAYKTYKAVKREWENLNKLFTEDQLELLREIN